MKTHSIVYVTFAPEDMERARTFLEGLSALHPTVSFVGRHQLGFPGNPQDVDCAIQQSTITLILVGQNTAVDPTVTQDICASRAKTPPNRLIAMFLADDATLQEGSTLGQALGEIGAECIAAGGDIAGGLARTLLLVQRAEPIIKTADRPPSAETCSR